MTIIRAAIGDIFKEFSDNTSIEEVWEFVDSHMAKAVNEKGIVLMDDGGATIGEIWDSSMYFAHWETPSKMLAYFVLSGFDQGD